MTTHGSLQPVAEQLTAHASWHAWVLEYGITHHRMVLALHLGAYPETAKVELLDCVHFAGSLQGGPYPLALAEVDYKGDTLYEIRSADGAFQVVFGAARLLRELPS